MDPWRMAARKTQKSTKKPQKKAAKSARKPARRAAAPRASAKRRKAPARPKVRAKKKVVTRAKTRRAAPKPKRRAASAKRSAAKRATTKRTTTARRVAKATRAPAKRRVAKATKPKLTKKAAAKKVATKKRAVAKKATVAKKKALAKKKTTARKPAPARRAVAARKSAPAKRKVAGLKKTARRPEAAKKKAGLKKAAPSRKAELAKKLKKAEKAELAKKPKKAEKAERAELAKKLKRAEKAELTKKPKKAEKAERAELTKKAKKAEKAELAKKPKKAEKAELAKKPEVTKKKLKAEKLREAAAQAEGVAKAEGGRKSAREAQDKSLNGASKRAAVVGRKALSREQAGAREGRVAPMREPPRIVTLPLPMVAPPRRPTIEERFASIEKRLAAQSEEFRRRYYESFDMSWIYHDSALEGVVYTFEELRMGLSGQAPPVTDSSLQPTYDDIRRHKEAIEYVRDFGLKKRLPVTVDIIKKIYLILHPEEGDIKTVKFRKDIPQHRLYFHEYAPPDKIAYKVRQIVDWLNDPETRKTRNGIRIAARAHYDLLRVYPFPTDSGKVARLFMNLLLMRSDLPPAIIHSTERQRYYEALKGSATTVLQMVQEAVENSLASVEKLLDEHESRKRAFVS